MSEEEEEDYESEYEEFGRETYMRNKGFQLSLDAMQPNEGDWIILSDIDEIPKRPLLQQIRNPHANTESGRRLTEGHDESDGDVITLGCGFYYYSFEFRHQDEWFGPVMFRYRDKDSPIYKQTGDTTDGKREYPYLESPSYCRGQLYQGGIFAAS